MFNIECVDNKKKQKTEKKGSLEQKKSRKKKTKKQRQKKKKDAPIDAYATLDNRKHLLNYIKVLTNSVSASFFFF